jgi:hypothetical protein
VFVVLNEPVPRSAQAFPSRLEEFVEAATAGTWAK